jgi:hypothetical protein
MAKCKLCKTNIPDGTEYCKNCQENGKTKTNESYLDSLLNSVKNPVPAVESIYKKKTDVKSSLPEPISFAAEKEDASEDTPDYEDYNVDIGDVEDFEQYFKDEDFNEISIDDEKLFGESLSDLFEDNKGKRQNHDKSKQAINDILQEEVLTEETPESLPPEAEDIQTLLKGNQELSENITEEIENEEETVTLNNVSDNFIPEEISESQEEEEESGLDPDLDELLNSLDSLPNNGSVSPAPDEENEIAYTDNESLASEDIRLKPADSEEFEQVEAEEDDFLSLLNQISDDDPVVEDVKAINDLLNGKPVEPKKSSTPSDVGEVFSDALRVVSSLNDPSINEAELLDKIPDRSNIKDKKKQKKSKNDNNKKGTNKEETTPKKSKPKQGLLKLLFGNVKDEKTAKEAKAQKLREQEAAAAKEKPKKEKKGKKGAPVKNNNEEESLTGARGKGRPADDQDQDLKENGKDKKEKKKDKKEKKKKTKEIIQVIDEIEEDEGRINRLGASIVFLFFGLLVVLLLVGTNVVSYTLSIQHATEYFGKQKYNQAYKEVYGVDIQDKDLVIYEKIMTVMFVNKQLNSYNNYYALGEYPEALDSLLKGLKRYDKYIELATYLGIKPDFDYVRSQILAELKNVFHLSEKEAVKIISNEDMKEYSLEIYNVVLEKMNN